MLKENRDAEKEGGRHTFAFLFLTRAGPGNNQFSLL